LKIFKVDFDFSCIVIAPYLFDGDQVLGCLLRCQDRVELVCRLLKVLQLLHELGFVADQAVDDLFERLLGLVNLLLVCFKLGFLLFSQPDPL
jgi:hypothetical protein